MNEFYETFRMELGDGLGTNLCIYPKNSDKMFASVYFGSVHGDSCAIVEFPDFTECKWLPIENFHEVKFVDYDNGNRINSKIEQEILGKWKRRQDIQDLLDFYTRETIDLGGVSVSPGIFMEAMIKNIQDYYTKKMSAAAKQFIKGN